MLNLNLDSFILDFIAFNNANLQSLKTVDEGEDDIAPNPETLFWEFFTPGYATVTKNGEDRTTIKSVKEGDKITIEVWHNNSLHTTHIEMLSDIHYKYITVSDMRGYFSGDHDGLYLYEGIRKEFAELQDIHLCQEYHDMFDTMVTKWSNWELADYFKTFREGK